MIKTNLGSTTISGYFGITEERKIEIDGEFKKIRAEQMPMVLADIMKSIDESGLERIGFYRIPVLNAYLHVAKTENEQVYVAFMTQLELSFFAELMNTAVHGALINQS